MSPVPRVAIVGATGIEHVGRHLLRAATDAGLDAFIADTTEAYAGPRWLRVANWRLRGHRPTRLTHFSRAVVQQCLDRRPQVLIATGLAPLDTDALVALGQAGIRRVCFLTDDPWNDAHRAPWFMAALPHYDLVLTPRDNIDDLRKAACRRVEFMRFGYAPDIHVPEPPDTDAERQQFASDVVFIGGADADRLAWVEPLMTAGFRVALYGGYWDRYPSTRGAALGMADPRTVRKAIGGAATALCLVRRANRDGHSMRSLEVPAIGACMLVEDTPDHRALFGDAGETVLYVNGPDEARDALRRVLADPGLRARLASAAHTRVVHGGHTWNDRLDSILRMVPGAE